MSLIGDADALAWQAPRSQDTLACPLVCDVAPIDEHEWDAPIGDNDFFNSHRWL